MRNKKIVLKKFSNIKKRAIILLIIFGLISLLGDIIYEGARSITGPYLSVLGANAAIIGFVVGFAELFGYLLRLISGYLSDRTKSYWLFTILGYGLLISIPLLSLSSIWQIAAILIVLERIGKGLRSPARDTIASYAAKQVGTGVGFGFLELLDQTGATLGPIILGLFFISLGSGTRSLVDYQAAYRLFFIPFIILMILLFFAYSKVRHPHKLENNKKTKELDNNGKIFKNYMIFTFLTTFGFVNFAIIGYHLKYNSIFIDAIIPILYAFGMVVDALAGIFIGVLYDRMKKKSPNFNILLIIPIFTAISIILLFSFNIFAIILGTFFWGFVLGTHETIMKAIIADITKKEKRATSYGTFHILYGFSLFAGSSIAGFLYESSLLMLILVMVSFQIFSLVFFLKNFVQLKRK
ncbi:MAG: MFS transporter [Candidatus Aenigmatarchaeota archaeon]|nr:MFS transporter [Candidatus Aenigmarchaeota archaeon]